MPVGIRERGQEIEMMRLDDEGGTELGERVHVLRISSTDVSRSEMHARNMIDMGDAKIIRILVARDAIEQIRVSLVLSQVLLRQL